MHSPVLANLFDRLYAVPPVWHVVWAGLACLSLALVLLSWTRWGQSKPIQKCAVLSLLAHVLLACLTTTVKIVASADSTQTRAAVHVALVSGEEGTKDPTASAREVQPWDGLQSGPVSAPETPRLDRPQQAEAEPITFSESFEKIDEPQRPFQLSALEPAIADESNLLPPSQSDQQPAVPMQPTPVETPARVAAPPQETQPMLTPQAMSKPPTAAEQATTLVPPESWEEAWRGTKPSSPHESTDLPANLLPPITEPIADELRWISPRRTNEGDPLVQAATDATPLVPPVQLRQSSQPAEGARRSDEPASVASIAQGSGPSEASPDRPSIYRHRHPQERARLVQDHGGTEETEAAVHRALVWLARAQSQDGRWDAVRHGAGREMAVHGHDRQGAGTGADTGMTGLALLAFFGAGHTHVEGNYREHVQQGLDFLIRTQKPDGSLAGDATLYAQMYCHAMAAFALSEAYAMTRDAALVEPVRRAVAYTVAAQHSGGGWRYRPGDPGDTSQHGWQVMALASAELAGVSTPEPVWRRAEEYLQSVSRGRTGGLAAYQPGTGVSRTMSAEATYSKLLLADRQNRVADMRGVCEETAEYIRTEPPGTGKVNLYYWYYATLFLHLRQHDSLQAREDWRFWNERLQQTLLTSQHRTGPLEGAWGSDTTWGGYGGRVYTTALAALCLETYYRYLPFLETRENRTANRPGLLYRRAFDTRD